MSAAGVFSSVATEHYSHVSLEEKRGALDKMVAFIGIAGQERASAKGAGAPLGDLLGNRANAASKRTVGVPPELTMNPKCSACGRYWI